MRTVLSSCFAIFSILLYNCQGSDASTASASGDFRKSQEFNEYWKQGRTEHTTYTLEGNTDHKELTMVFEVEPFSRRKYVKLDNPDRAGDDLVYVLKSNMRRRGGNESLMKMVYTPLDRAKFPNSTKATFSAQGLSGHSYIQMRLYNNQYRVNSHSYLEDKDQDDFNMQKLILEDELWNLIRSNYTNLPEGKFQILPSMLFIHDTQRALEPLVANGTLIREDSMMHYLLEYTQPKRELKITFGGSFPYTITKWTEEYEGSNRQSAKVIGILKTPESTVKRDSLALDSTR